MKWNEISMTHNFCIKCKRNLPVSCFNKDKNRKNGLQSWCRDCQNIYNDAYSKTKVGKLVNIKSTSKWINSHKDEHKEYQHIYHKDKREYLNEKQKEYRQTPKGIKVSKKDVSRRQRQLGWIPICENPYPDDIEIEWHHIDDIHVVPIPSKVHRVTCGIDNHREVCYLLISKLSLFSMS